MSEIDLATLRRLAAQFDAVSAEESAHYSAELFVDFVRDSLAAAEDHHEPAGRPTRRPRLTVREPEPVSGP